MCKVNKDVASTLTNIGLVYSGQGDFHKALDYYNQSKNIYDKLQIKYNEYANCLYNIANLYFRVAEYK
jgi:tetratricopeptide (TPR) repeat protein